MSKKSSIKSLIRKAENGSLMAAYTLFEYYSNGSYVDKDESLAKQYSEQIRGQEINLRFRVLSVSLDSFKGFKTLKVNLHNGKSECNSIAFTGVNGVGKSTILEAIAKGLGWFSQRMISPKNTSAILTEQDIFQSKLEKSDFASIALQLQIGDHDIFTVELSKSRGESNLNLKGYYDEINALTGIYRHINEENPSFGLPVIAFYCVDRAAEITLKDIEQSDEVKSDSRQKKLDGYKKSISGNAHFSSFFRWLKDAQDVQNNRIAKSYASKELRQLKEFLDAKRADLSSDDISKALITLSEKLKSERTTNIANDEELLFDRNIKVISQAIEAFLPGFSNFRIQYEPSLDLLLDKHEVTLSVLQLSQGEKSLLALVADIARRLVLLNPESDEPLNGDGVIIIDEIDLHLHPEWQQQVYMKLSSVFKNVQFIFSTHSPQVLSTMKRESIRVVSVDEVGEGLAVSPQSNTYAMSSNNVMHEVMAVDPEPPVPEKPLLDELTSLVENGSHDSLRVIELIEVLSSKLSQSNPQLQRIIRSIKRLQVLSK